MKAVRECGIYFGMPEGDYFASEGLSNSGMKQLAVSPLNYWHHNLNPDYERQDETQPQRIGRVVHCRLLEVDRFKQAYGRELSEDDLPDALHTIDDMKVFLAANNLPVSGKKKQDYVDRILDSGIPATIWDIEEAKHLELNQGKILLTQKEADLIECLAGEVLADPCVAGLLKGGIPEVSFFVRDPETGVQLKARMDYMKPSATIDVKTFSNSRGKPTDKVVFDSIYYESYHLQTVAYHTVRELARQGLAAGSLKTYGNVPEAWLKAFVDNEEHGFGFLFVESSPPFDMRVIEMRHSEAAGGVPNVYWSAAKMQMDGLVQLYAESKQRYGDKPWREKQTPHLLSDTDIPQLMFA